MLVGELLEIAWNEYQEFYDNPRGIHYFEIEEKVGHSNIRVIDYVAEAIDTGCDDKQNGRVKRTRKELFEKIGHPDDERWGLIEE